MTTIRLKTGRTALFGAMMVVALIALLPARIVLGALQLGTTGFSARVAGGSIWSGTLTDATFGGAPLGDIDVRLVPWELPIGRALVKLSGQGEDGLHADIGVARNIFVVAHATATIAAGRQFAPLPIGTLNLDDVTIRFRDGACELAQGRITALVTGDLAGVSLGQNLSGSVRCDGTAMLIPLVSQAGNTSVAFRVQESGIYTATVTIQSGDPDVVQRLSSAGFRATPTGQTITVTGSF